MNLKLFGRPTLDKEFTIISIIITIIILQGTLLQFPCSNVIQLHAFVSLKVQDSSLVRHLLTDPMVSGSNPHLA